MVPGFWAQVVQLDKAGGWIDKEGEEIFGKGLHMDEMIDVKMEQTCVAVKMDLIVENISQQIEQSRKSK